MSLVTSMALKATHGSPPFKYLGVINDGSQTQGYLEYSKVLTKNAKFAVEYAFNGCVHIRSSLTNKYWVRSSTNGNWIVAQGVKPVVDQKSWTCTLFRMDMDDKKKAKLYHVQSGRTIRILNDGSARRMFLTIDPAAKTEALSIVVDYDSLVVLPKFVAFKGSNGLFYKNESNNGKDWYAHFSVSDIGNLDIVCEIRYSSDGHIRVRAANCSSDDMFWEYKGTNDDNLIGEAYDNPLIVDQMFAAIKVYRNVVALRSLRNNKICKIGDVPHGLVKKDRLVATADWMTRDTYLEVVEPLLRRTVNVYEFNLDKARIYDVTLLYSDDHEWINSTSELQSGTTTCSITTTKSRTYSNNISVSGTVTTSFETGVPFLVNGAIQVSATASYAHQWGTTTEESQQVGDTFTVVVKPMKRTIARGVATKGKCDVPFSYVQKDYPTSGGNPIVTKLHDGVFTGANAYSFQHEVRYEELPPGQGLSRQSVTKFIRPVKLVAK